MSVTCSRCGFTALLDETWNGSFSRGVLIEIICGRCQSADENMEAAIREATSNYSIDSFGLARSSVKVSHA